MTLKLISLLSEVRVIDLAKDDEQQKKYFFLYKDKMFILDDKSPVQTINSRVKQHIKDHPDINKKSKYNVLTSGVSVEDFMSSVVELGPDIVAGEYFPEHSAIVIYGEVQARSSLNVKKMVKQLGIKNVTMRHVSEPKHDDITDVEYTPKKLLGDIPDVVYHGTNSRELKDILKYGLDPGRGPTRFPNLGIVHTEHSFFTATFQEAIYYAFHAWYEAKKEKQQMWRNYPIILEIKIPDKDLVSPDYDADISVKHPRYFQGRTSEPVGKSEMKPMGVSREVGKWSYKGRIPAKFILWVYYYKHSDDKWRKSRPVKWKKLLDRYDLDTIAYKLGMNTDDVA